MRTNYLLSGRLATGYITDRERSPLTGRERVRVVDFPSEATDPEAGRWIDSQQLRPSPYSFSMLADDSGRFYVNVWRYDETDTFRRETLADDLTESEATALLAALEPVAARFHLP